MNKYALAVGLFFLGLVVGFVPLIFGTLLFLAGWEDYRKHEVPDILTSGMWLVIFVCNIQPTVAVASFAVLYAICAWVVRYDLKWNGTALNMGWGDVLALPPFLAFMWGYGAPALVACVVGFLLFDYVHRKKGGPFFPFMMCAFWAVAITSEFIVAASYYYSMAGHSLL